MNTAAARYTRVAIILHWLIAALLLLNGALGVLAANFSDPLSRRSLLDFHKPLGLFLLALIVARVAWRLFHRPPLLPETLMAWEVRASGWSHRLLYAAMLILPISGWLLTSFAPQPHPILVGGVQIPFLPVQRSGPGASLSHNVHVASSVGLALLITLHILAVVHHARRGASVLPRMLFGARDGSRSAQLPDV